MKLNYSEGTWFAIPLRKGGFGVGVAARTMKKGPVILAYLFGPKRELVPTLPEVVGLDPFAAVKVARIGDLSLINGEWPILGRSSSWLRNNWPNPKFVTWDGISRRAWIVQYADDNPNNLVSQEPVVPGTFALDRDIMYGAGAVEIELSRLLGGDAPREADPVAPSAEPAQPGGLSQGVRYFLYIPERKKAEALAARLRGEGFEVETRRGADETNWLVLVHHSSLEEDTIARLEEQLTRYAEASGGEYDGYER